MSSPKAPATTTDVTFTYNPVLPPACYPADVNGLAQLLTQGGVLNGTIPSNAGGGIYIGSSPPSSSLTYKVWFKTDSAGRPLGIYMYYNGNWRKVYTNIGVGEIRMFSGSATNIFDSTGLGLPGNDMDGWAICNGQNGTPNLSTNFFPVSGVWNGGNTGTWAAWDPPSGSWKNQGGQGQLGHKIAASDLPSLQVTAGSAAGRLAAGTTGSWVTVPPYTSGGIEQSYSIPVTDSNGNPTGQNTALPLPNYIALGFVMFVGYK